MFWILAPSCWSVSTKSFGCAIAQATLIVFSFSHSIDKGVELFMFLISVKTRSKTKCGFGVLFRAFWLTVADARLSPDRGSLRGPAGRHLRLFCVKSKETMSMVLAKGRC